MLVKLEEPGMRPDDPRTSPGPILDCLETSINLAGQSEPERLLVTAEGLRVEGESGSRHWRFAELDAFQVESAVGSCFLQAHGPHGWEDLLRWPGEDDGTLSRWVDGLQARCRLGQWPEESERAETLPPRAPPHWHNLRRIVALLQPFSGTAALVLGLSVLAAAIEVAPPLLLQTLVDRVLKIEPRHDLVTLLTLLLWIVVALLVVRLAAAAVAIGKGRLSSWLGTTLTATLRNDLVRTLNALPLAFHDRHQVGLLMSRVAYDTESLHTFVYHMTSGLLLQLLQLVAIAGMLFYLNPKLALVTMVPMPLIVAGSWYFARYLNPRNHHYWEAVGQQAAALTGMLSGIRVVKAFVQEDRESRRFRSSSLRLRDSRQVVDASTATFTAVMGFLFALGTLAVWYTGGRDVLFQQMTLGSLMAFIAYLAMFFTPLTTLAESTTSFSNFWTASQRIFELLETPPEEERPGPAVLPTPVAGRIEFEHVGFGYRRNQPVLTDISFTIEPGQFVGIVGRSGSGKSTLVSLLARLYEIDSGRILLDEVDTRQVPSRQLRRQIGLVLQEPFLFRGSVAENLTYGAPEATPEEILCAARWADAHDFILRMPLGYETQLGESGSGLSGGERQRLSIARALICNPAILILDEATSSVDAESERAIRDALRQFSQGRTTIAIAHRLSTLQGADQLLVFDQGRLIERGTHEELVARHGVYDGLVRLQCLVSEHERTSEASDRGRGPHELRWLDPRTTAIRDTGRGALAVIREERCVSEVRALRAFPASCDACWISLRQGEPSGGESELGLIRNLEEWPPATQAAVRRSLDRRYLLRRIQAILQLHTRGHQLEFAVQTDQGPARFVIERPQEASQRFGPQGLLLVDHRGHWYVIPDRTALPRAQQRLLSLYFEE